jgi:hypothetical protein
MTTSDDDRERFRQIGRDRLAAALAEGRLQSLGITENLKPAAIKWVKEQDAEQARHEAQQARQQNVMCVLTAIAAVASVIAAAASVAALFR